MSHNTQNVILNNITNISESIFAWILTIIGFRPHFELDPGDMSIDGLLRKATLLLACAVSVATLYKINRDLKKNDKK